MKAQDILMSFYAMGPRVKRIMIYWHEWFLLDMKKDQIFPRMRFVNNKNFRKKYISKFLTITRIIVEIIICRL